MLIKLLQPLGMVFISKYNYVSIEDAIRALFHKSTLHLNFHTRGDKLGDFQDIIVTNTTVTIMSLVPIIEYLAHSQYGNFIIIIIIWSFWCEPTAGYRPPLKHAMQLYQMQPFSNLFNYGICLIILGPRLL